MDRQGSHRSPQGIPHDGSRFASALDVSVRTVANWVTNPATAPRAAVQETLDRLLESASPAILVLRDDQVLLVCRRNKAAGIAWQFPAVIVKPGENAEEVAVRETLAETGVHCTPAGHIGGRLHPVTGACGYAPASEPGTTKGVPLSSQRFCRWTKPPMTWPSAAMKITPSAARRDTATDQGASSLCRRTVLGP
jgi:NUDIX domain